MSKTQNSKPVYDLEERTFLFAKNVRLWVKTLPNTLAILEDAKQLIKSSGSVGANYLEAKESHYWLRLIHDTNIFKDETGIKRLIQEAIELKKILSSIVEKSK